MDLYTYRKKRFLHIVKNGAIVVSVPLLFAAGAHAEAPDVKAVVASISGLEAPVALVGGAYIGLKVFQRGWKIIKGFI